MSAPITEPEAQAPEPQAPSEAEAPQPNEAEIPEWARTAISKANGEAAKYRTQLREAEPILKAHAEAEERNKTEIQRATERAEQLARDLAAKDQQINLLMVAGTYGIPKEDHDLLGSGTPEEMESRAVRIAQMRASATGSTAAPATPPTNRPVESLRPGASPQPPAAEDNSYPANWLPASRDRS